MNGLLDLHATDATAAILLAPFQKTRLHQEVCMYANLGATDPSKPMAA